MKEQEKRMEVVAAINTIKIIIYDVDHQSTFVFPLKDNGHEEHHF